MPTSLSLDIRPSRTSASRKLTSASPVTISAPQRRRPLTSTASKENFTGFTQQKTTSSCRSSKNGRLSDRWQVLNRIIRASKVSRDQPPSDDMDSSSSSEDEGDVIPHAPNLRQTPKAPQYNPHIVHPASPKFPSPLSGVKLVNRQTVARHNYVHHGHSQSALYHQRELWRKRKSDWEEYEYMLWQAGVTLEEAYGGIIDDSHGRAHALSPHLMNGPSRRTMSTNFQETIEMNSRTSNTVNPATFPRLGDLSSLRDSFLISVDTWFSNFPLWTLSKLVWIYDVNHRFYSASTVHRGTETRLRNNFLEDFGESNSSADTLLSTFTNGSDSTLVNAYGTKSFRRPVDPALALPYDGKSQTSGNSLPQSSALVNVLVNNQVRPWETCWFSRWEILYHQVSLAADIAASPGNSNPSGGSKEAARIILMTPTVLYDPLAFDGEGNGTKTMGEKGTPTATRLPGPGAEYRGVAPMEEEDDYGEVIYTSKYRFGAYVDPLSMFATATTEDAADLSSSTCEAKPDNSSQSWKDYEVDKFEIVTRLEELALCC